MYVTQGLKRAVQVNGNGIATIDDDRQRTWSEFADRVAKLAGGLQKLGFQEGDRAAVLAFNSDYYLEYFFAIPWAGGIILPLNMRLASPELIYMLNDAEVKILVVDNAHVNLLEKIIPEAKTIQQIILMDGGDLSQNAFAHEAIINTSEPVPDAQRGGDDVVGIFYTGGTTGVPKGVMLTHDNMVSNALVGLACMYLGEPWMYLHSAPMFHIADCQWNVGVTLHAGTHLFMRKFVPLDMVNMIEKYKIRQCSLVPTMVNMLCNAVENMDVDLSSLELLNYGGSPMSTAIIARARPVFPNCKFVQGYGQTETSPIISLLFDQYHVTEGPHAVWSESAGQPVFSVEVRIVDADDNEVPLGEIGEVVARGPNIMLGYWNKPEETARALRNGWMHTGDIGYMDADGFLYIVDRLKDVIISGGENIYSSEVEIVIYQHPAVALCAVIGIPSDQWGESVHAVILLKEGQTATEEEIITYCRDRIAHYKCPRTVEFRRDGLPMSGAGKILKRELRTPYWEGKTRSVN